MFHTLGTNLITRISGNQYISGVCNVFIMLLPVSLISAFCMLIGNGASYLEMEIISQRLHHVSSLVWQLFPILLIAYFSQFLSCIHKVEKIAVMTPSMVIYFIVSYQWELLKVGTVIPTNYPLALLVPLAVSFCLKKTKHITPRMDSSLPNIVEKSINMLLSCCVLVLTFSLSSYFLRNVVFADFDITNVLPHLDPTSLSDGLLYELARNLFWAIGINGHIILASYKTEIYHLTIDLIEQHQTLGTPLPILTSNFYDFYAGLGGAGNTLSLVICMIVCSKRPIYKKFGIAVLILSIFNINEPVIYGLPIMFNPILIIPFLLVPVFSLVIAYFATYIGWVPPVSEVMSWMTPPLISGYIGTGNSIEGALLQLVIIILGVLAYRPFLKQMEDFGTVSNIFSNSVSKAFTNEPQHDLSTQSISAFVPQLSNNISAQKLLTKLRDTGQFILYYQPQYDTHNKRIIGVEALIRHKADDGAITPPYFLSAFSRLELMQELDLWVIETTLSEMAELSNEPNFKVSINISPDTLLIDHFDSHISKLLSQSKLNSAQIELEITEDVLVKDEKRTKIAVDNLRKMGITIALDDFGSGFSSLGHLCKFEFDKVKIDRSFVLNLSTEKGKEVFRLTCRLVKVGGASVVVEGVEDQSELDFISEQGISIIQGFYFYKPMPFSELIQLRQFNKVADLSQ